MKVIKCYNNSIVLAEHLGRQVVVIGSGCGYGKKPGDAVDESRISTTFPFTSAELERLNLGLLEKLDSRDLAVVKEIVDEIGGRLGYSFRSSMVFSLVDHLRNYLPGRYLDEEHPFRWIVKKTYPAEYEAAKLTIQRLAESELRLVVPHAEATAIALHFINNQDAQGIRSTMDATEHVHKVVSILEYRLNRPLDRTTLKYSRVVTHLRFLINRMQQPDTGLEDTHTDLFHVVYQQASALTRDTVDSICGYLRGAFAREVGDAERGYLLIYIHDFTSGLGPPRTT